jgi:hypothetical protein
MQTNTPSRYSRNKKEFHSTMQYTNWENKHSFLLTPIVKESNLSLIYCYTEITRHAGNLLCCSSVHANRLKKIPNYGLQCSHVGK